MVSLLNNFLIIYPHKDKKILKQLYGALGLKDFTVSIVIIKDNLSDDEQKEYIEYVNKNLKYSGQINTSSENMLLESLEKMSGSNGDNLYVFKDGKIIHKKLEI